jgi:hypothetical protein
MSKLACFALIHFTQQVHRILGILMEDVVSVFDGTMILVVTGL